jgi:hypothetical protein
VEICTSIFVDLQLSSFSNNVGKINSFAKKIESFPLNQISTKSTTQGLQQNKNELKSGYEEKLKNKFITFFNILFQFTTKNI